MAIFVKSNEEIDTNLDLKNQPDFSQGDLGLEMEDMYQFKQR